MIQFYNSVCVPTQNYILNYDLAKASYKHIQKCKRQKYLFRSSAHVIVWMEVCISLYVIMGFLCVLAISQKHAGMYKLH